VKFNPVLWNLRNKKPNSADAAGNVKGKGKLGENERAASEETSKGSAVDENHMEVDGQAKIEARTQTTIDPAITPVATSPPLSASEDPFIATSSSSLFELKQRTIYAVATHETILIYDTQQSSPICMFGSLHFAAFTDLAWTADGSTLIATSSDGYASIFTFEDGELGVPCEVQPKRILSPLEESNKTFVSPVKSIPAVSTNTSNTPPMATTLPAPTALSPLVMNSSPAVAPRANGTAPVNNFSLLKREDSDIILLDGPTEPKKEKKRAPLQHLGPLNY